MKDSEVSVEQRLTELKSQLDEMAAQLVEMVASARKQGRPSAMTPEFLALQEERNEMLREVNALCQDPKNHEVARGLGIHPQVWESPIPRPRS